MRRRRHVLVVALTAGGLILAGCTDGGGAKRSEQAAPAAGPLPDIGGAAGDQTVATDANDADFDAPDAPDALPDIGAAAKPDLGFRPKSDGFPFPNYSNAGKPTNLIAQDMRDTFGDVVCSDTKGGRCTLTPIAKKQMEKWNSDMGGGHCYGFSVAALLFYKDKLKPKAYGAPSVSRLEPTGKVEREIAQRWIAQKFGSVRSKVLYGSPNRVLDQLTDYLRGGSKAAETYTIAIFNPQGTGGHAITPYSVVDKGKGKFAVLVYDNNWPGKPRQILFDRNANKWSYYAALNPGVPGAKYYGDETTPRIYLFPTNPGLGKQPCSFCAGTISSIDINSDAPSFGTVALSDAISSDHPRLLLTAPDGKRTGWVDGVLVNEIPGVQIHAPLLDETWNYQPEPEYQVPAGLRLTVTIDAAGVVGPSRPAEVNYIANGKAVAVGNIAISPGEKDVLTIPAGGAELAYAAGAGRSPVFTLGADDAAGPDYAFTVAAKGLPAGGSVSLGLAAAKLSVDTTGAGAAIDVDLGMLRQDSEGPLDFAYSSLRLDRSVAGLLYPGWTADGQAIDLEVTRDGKTQRASLADGGQGPATSNEPAPSGGGTPPTREPATAPPTKNGPQPHEDHLDVVIPLPNGEEIVIHLEKVLPPELRRLLTRR